MIAAAALGLALAWSVLILLRTLHVLQLESYVTTRLLRWMAADPARAARVLSRPAGSTKKPLVFTGRAIRTAMVAGFVLLLFAAAVAVGAAGSIAWTIAGAISIVLAAPFVVPLSNWLLAPVQRAINGRFLRTASARLAEAKPIVIGITGSYGKTSTKHFLQTILSQRYRTLMTPGSYNTYMGVCRVINEQLAAEHEVFIVEMAAYGRGEIREIADLVHPRIGILTAIGPQHLEWFGSIENIEATKYELMQSLPPGGAAVFNADDPRCRALADRTTHVKVLRFGIIAPGTLRVRAEGIAHSRQGLSFVLVDDSATRVPVATRLLGRHNVPNILAAAAAALELGLSLEDIAAGAARLEAPEHRLQPLEGAGGVTVIDDAYNSNPEGAAEALDVLRQFTTGRKVLVTPGMVELGPLQEEANKTFGRQAAAICDHVILVGPAQTRPIRAGLEEAGFAADRVTSVNTLKEAEGVLQRILKPGDVVLFENDLPDQYAES
ncbi:MAG TPA: UDP-N-acetylmuramoyl-tripeptide--D-alanyl-D-alanine ligase [bacterium]|nr:UDP-N-acetylmuramoyl-tripeptide--D-alanyl-D-alanine ligase [bacterium]